MKRDCNADNLGRGWTAATFFHAISFDLIAGKYYTPFHCIRNVRSSVFLRYMAAHRPTTLSNSPLTTFPFNAPTSSQKQSTHLKKETEYYATAVLVSIKYARQTRVAVVR